MKVVRPVPPLATDNVPVTVLTFTFPINEVALIFPTTSNASRGSDKSPIPTLPSLRITNIGAEILYSSSANFIFNFVLDLPETVAHFVKLKEALVPVFKFADTPPTLHKCKTSLLSLIVVITVLLVIVNGAKL